MKTCKHPKKRQHVIMGWDWTRSIDAANYKRTKCHACGEWMSLGPSRDPRSTEIRAATMYAADASKEQHRFSNFTAIEFDWYVHGDKPPHAPERWPETEEEHAALLAHVIDNHHEDPQPEPVTWKFKTLAGMESPIAPTDKGTVTHWNRDSCVAVVRTDDRRIFNVHSTSFHGNNDWPYVGQRVEIVFNGLGDLLAVHELAR